MNLKTNLGVSAKCNSAKQSLLVQNNFLINFIRKLINKKKKAYYNNFKNEDSKMWWKTEQQVSGKLSKLRVTTHTAEELNKGFHAIWNNIKN
jgi:hypothetical protein